jgi:hypothetical protein
MAAASKADHWKVAEAAEMLRKQPILTIKRRPEELKHWFHFHTELSSNSECKDIILILQS